MVRKVFIPNNENIMLTIPQQYVGMKLEVIAYPIEEDTKGVSHKKVAFTDFGLDAPEYQFNREEANAR